jgi:hypothetical protein
MQLAPITQSVPVAPTAAPLPTSVDLADRAPHQVRSIAPAAPTTGAAKEAAIDGVARLLGAALATPIVDFPGIATGDRFDIVKGSKVGFLGVKGEAEVLALTDDNASFKIRAGAFGVKVNVVVDVVRTGADTVRISSRGSGIPDQQAEGRVLASRTNFAEFERIDNPAERTAIAHDGNGRIEIDTVVPTFGQAHLVLVKRR